MSQMQRRAGYIRANNIPHGYNHVDNISYNHPPNGKYGRPSNLRNPYTPLPQPNMVSMSRVAQMVPPSVSSAPASYSSTGAAQVMPPASASSALTPRTSTGVAPSASSPSAPRSSTKYRTLPTGLPQPPALPITAVQTKAVLSAGDEGKVDPVTALKEQSQPKRHRPSPHLPSKPSPLHNLDVPLPPSNMVNTSTQAQMVRSTSSSNTTPPLPQMGYREPPKYCPVWYAIEQLRASQASGQASGRGPTFAQFDLLIQEIVQAYWEYEDKEAKRRAEQDRLSAPVEEAESPTVSESEGATLEQEADAVLRDSDAAVAA